jgi:hypothetical protein
MPIYVVNVCTCEECMYIHKELALDAVRGLMLVGSSSCTVYVCMYVRVHKLICVCVVNVCTCEECMHIHKKLALDAVRSLMLVGSSSCTVCVCMCVNTYIILCRKGESV